MPAGEATASADPRSQQGIASLFLNERALVSGTEAGIAPPLPQPQWRQSRCDRHFPWLRLLSLPPNTEQTPSSCRTGVTSNTAHTGHVFPTPGHLCSNMAQTGVFLRSPGYLTSAPQAALLFSLVLTSFYLSCGTGNSSEL